MSNIKEKNIIGLKELRLNFDRYIRATNRGETFLVMKKSEPAFKIAPVDDSLNEEKWETLADFSSEVGGGVKATKLLEALKK